MFFLNHLDGKSKETEILLFLYEFEALVKLRDPRVEALMEKALTLPGSDPKTFETMAGEVKIEPWHVISNNVAF